MLRAARTSATPGPPAIAAEPAREAPVAAPVDYAVSNFPRASAARRAAARAGYIRSPRRPRLLVNQLDHDIAPDPTDTASWALSYGNLELL
jgi:hypothetical protein